MPTYLCHGFRWHRRAIRIYVILNDLEDAASNWIIGPATSSSIIDQFYTSYDFLPEVAPPQQEASVSIKAKKDDEHLDDDLSLPPSRVPPEHDGVLMHSWSAVKLLEEYDPEDITTPCRPYAYVADYVVRVDLSVDVAGEMAKYYEKMAGEDGWIVKLRDELQKGEPVRWYVVVCGDEVRDFPGESDDEESEEDSTSEYGGEADDALTALDDSPEEQEGRSTPRPPEQEWPDIRQPIQPSEPLPQRLSTSTTSSSQWSQEDAAAPPRLTPDIQIPLLRTFDSDSSRYSTSTASGLYHDGDRLLLEPEEFVMAQSPARTPLREEAPDIVMPIRAEELNPSLSAWSTTPSPHTELPDPSSHPYAEVMPSRSPSPTSPVTRLSDTFTYITKSSTARARAEELIDQPQTSSTISNALANFTNFARLSIKSDKAITQPTSSSPFSNPIPDFAEPTDKVAGKPSRSPAITDTLASFTYFIGSLTSKAADQPPAPPVSNAFTNIIRDFTAKATY
ncbi:uncharacterized protein NECHADRAFT_105910 [Fusarium vanettenii 77-13-4]|uniref:Uncharacterized protein n=1 Tax=Fusarium vanettenii (strain ATCC MYA-4622 / CBS 123669 / FGSC 9596 / NRRL 45880 / 77-13-4) TaxID=660122 RepID=C7Z4L8_FUSV7|nr:uncharacterized protein NECHADRAFT_105910 [Fusarium vanettenii 77-13-4]EEU40370.1 hypothetical protein NECHADRAFT_105910 [Fusarium vanettenii 77-13-4]